MNSVFLKMRGIVKTFPGTQALAGVDFDVRQGEVLGLIGENGAGKSTLMNIISGAFSDYQGSIEMDGKPVELRRPVDARAHGIVIIRQELSLFPDLDVARNIFLGNEPRLAGFVIDRRKMYARAAELLSEFNLNINPRTPVRHLTMAQKQMTEIARALSYNARLIIMDEPTSSLTEREVDILAGILQGLRAKGVAVIFITHKLQEIIRFCDRVHVFRDGRNADLVEKADFSTDRFIRGMVGGDLKKRAVRSKRTPGETVLEVKKLQDSFLKGISFKVGKGEVLGLAGPVGSGRTEIMESIFGLNPRMTGEITLAGKTLRPRYPGDAMAGGVALVPEDRKLHGLVLGMTVRENIVLSVLGRFSSAGFVKSSGSHRLAEESVRTFNIKVSGTEQSVGALSGGNQQKVVLSKWLASQPKVLLLDDPTRGIDVGAKQEIYGLVNKLASEGMAIIISSSEMDEVISLSDRILVLYDGQIKKEMPAAEATEELILAAANS